MIFFFFNFVMIFRFSEEAPTEKRKITGWPTKIGTVGIANGDCVIILI